MKKPRILKILIITGVLVLTSLFIFKTFFLYISIYNGHSTLTRLLVFIGANVNARDKHFDYSTPLISASFQGQNEIIELLIDSGADINAHDIGDTALTSAIKAGHLETVKLLIKKGADVNFSSPGDIQTPLMLAALLGKVDLVKLLIDAGADINAEKSKKNTALMNAARKGDVGIAKLLLNAGANVNAKDDKGYTAVTYAQALGHSEMVTLLIEHGADVAYKDTYKDHAEDHPDEYPIFSTGDERADIQEKNLKIEGLQVILNKVKEAVHAKNYEILKSYVSEKEPLSWGICGPTDVESEVMSVETMFSRLLEISNGAEIFVCEEPDISPWDIKESIFSVDIQTEGWKGEYPFLNFGFTYSKTGNRWEFIGVCDSVRPTLEISKNGKYEAVYCRKPNLPRPGPRIFQDHLALRTRIIEIVRFKEFEALKHYTIQKNLIFRECSNDMRDEAGIKGKEKPVEEIINFLKKNTAGEQKIKSSGTSNIDFCETKGWSGEYPYVSFWFAEGKQGWELNGVAYCRTSLMRVFFPYEPRFYEPRFE
ncbi:MAG: ankyrin repeat domain-containing protein [Nitrospirota bacterium]